jgi:hypothetical protein
MLERGAWFARDGRCCVSLTIIRFVEELPTYVAAYPPKRLGRNDGYPHRADIVSTHTLRMSRDLL